MVVWYSSAYGSNEEYGDDNQAPKPHLWQRKRIIIGCVIGLLVLIVLIIAARIFHWDLAGLSSSQTTTTTEVTLSPGKKSDNHRNGQNALGLVAAHRNPFIPIVVGFGTAIFTRQQARTSEANAENQQQEELLSKLFR